MRRKSILIVVGTLFLHLMVWGQSSGEMLKREYPQVYQSVVKNIDRQWGSNSNVKKNLIEAEANAFFVMMSMESWDWEILNKAVMTFSYSGKQNANEKIMKDFSVKNPLPLLRCDWYKVKSYYEKEAKKKGIITESNTYTRNNSGTLTDSNTSAIRQAMPDKENSTPYSNSNQRENSFSDYSQNREYSTDYYNYGKSENTQGFKFGIKIGAGMSTIIDASDLEDDVKLRPGLALEGGIVNLYRKNNMFLQNETTISQLRHSYKVPATRYYDEYKEEYSHLFLQTSIHIGGYINIGNNLDFFAGFGGFAAGRLESRYKWIEGNTQTEGRVSWDMKNFNLGISGLIGIEKDHFRFGLYPSLGLTKMEYGYNDKSFSLMLGATYWL